MSEILTFEISNAELKRKTRLFGKMDVYAVAQINQQRFETKICKGGDKNPRWNEVFEATIDSGNFLITEVWERDGGKHVLIGNGRHLLPEMKNEGGQMLWINVFHTQKAAGKILLNLISRRPNITEPVSKDNNEPIPKTPIHENKIEKSIESKIDSIVDSKLEEVASKEIVAGNADLFHQASEEVLSKKDLVVATADENMIQGKIRPFFPKSNKCFGTSDFSWQEIEHLQAQNKVDKEIQVDIYLEEPIKQTHDIETQYEEETKAEILIPEVMMTEAGSQTRRWEKYEREVILEHQIQMKKQKREARWASIPRQSSTEELPTSYLEKLTKQSTNKKRINSIVKIKQQQSLLLDESRPKFQLLPYKKRGQPEERYSQAQRLAYVGSYLLKQHAPTYDYYDLE